MSSDAPAIPISGLVPMLPVTDIERTAAFYQQLGFAIGNRVPSAGRMGWAWLYSPAYPDWRRGPNLMLTRSAQPLATDGPKLVLYFYANDLVQLRNDLIAAGQVPGEITYPDYLPKGEFSITDPDGYRVMVAQKDLETP